jgi:Homeodomain
LRAAGISRNGNTLSGKQSFPNKLISSFPNIYKTGLFIDGKACQNLTAMVYKTIQQRAVKFIDSTEEIKRSLKLRDLPKKKRTRLNDWQVKKLEEEYLIDSHPSSKVKNRVSKELKLSLKSVQIWFQNKRAKEKARSRDSGTEEERQARVEYKVKKEYDEEYCTALFTSQKGEEGGRKRRIGSSPAISPVQEPYHVHSSPVRRRTCIYMPGDLDPWEVQPISFGGYMATPLRQTYTSFHKDLILSQHRPSMASMHEEIGCIFPRSPAKSPGQSRARFLL